MFTNNNPINFIDPDGRAAVGVNSPDNEYKFTWNEETQQYDQQQISELGGNDFDVIHYEGGENDGNIEVAFNPATETPYTPERGGMIGERTAPGEWDTSWRGASGAATAGHYGELLPLPKLAFGKYLGKLLGWGGKKAAREGVEKAGHMVYRAIDESGTVRYVGVTSRGLTVRAAERN